MFFPSFSNYSQSELYYTDHPYCHLSPLNIYFLFAYYYLFAYVITPKIICIPSLTSNGLLPYEPRFVNNSFYKIFEKIGSALHQFVTREPILCKIWNVHFVEEFSSFQNLTFSCPNSKNWLLKSKKCVLICAWEYASIFF